MDIASLDKTDANGAIVQVVEQIGSENVVLGSMSVKTLGTHRINITNPINFMKIIISIQIVIFCVFPFIVQGEAKQNVERNQTQIIVEHSYRTIDSMFHLSESSLKSNFLGLRIVDTSKSLFSSSSWAYLKDGTPFVILKSFPFDWNSGGYCDIALYSINFKDPYLLKISIIFFIGENCDRIPFRIDKTFKILSNNKLELNGESIERLDNWDFLTPHLRW